MTEVAYLFDKQLFPGYIFESTTITGVVRDNLNIVERSSDFIIFKHGNFKENRRDELIKLFYENNADAVQLIDKSLPNDEKKLNSFLKSHIGTPTLIPHDFDEKKKYVKTLSKELQQHIWEKRGIELQ